MQNNIQNIIDRHDFNLGNEYKILFDGAISNKVTEEGIEKLLEEINRNNYEKERLDEAQEELNDAEERIEELETANERLEEQNEKLQSKIEELEEMIKPTLENIITEKDGE
jgi:predicted nuclease with TOPRIM domain